MAVIAPWQRANIQAAAALLRERLTSERQDTRMAAVYEGLLDVLDPPRRAVRMQRELATAAKAAVIVDANRDRRMRTDRRRADRRVAAGASPTGVELRAGRDRRAGSDRRNRS